MAPENDPGTTLRREAPVRARRWLGLRRVVVFVLGVAIVAGTAWYVTQSPQLVQKVKSGRRAAFQQDQPIPVLVASAKLADVPVYLDGVGTARALNTVTVRAQIDGQLIKVAFREGQEVKKGFVLAEIDPRSYQAQLEQAQAKKAQDEAQLANARLDLERYERLAATNSASKQQADTARAQVAQLTALVKADQAAIDNAQILLGYTKVIAPIDGRTGLRQVDEGNLVRGSDATGIVMITQLRPISVLFNLPQQQLSQVNKAFAAGKLAVDALGPDGKTIIDRGALQVVDNQVDPTTGTVRMKAEFPNADLQLWPGQFVNARLLIETLKTVVVVPTAAVQRGPNGTFAFVLQGDDTVAVRPVTVTQQDDTQAVIADGLKADERVVTTGFTRLANGSRVAVVPGGTQTQPPPAAQPEKQKRWEGKRKRDGVERPDGEKRRRSEATPTKSD